MEFPAELQGRINELAEGVELKTLKSAAAQLSESYRSESELGKRGAASKTDALAYAAVRMAATFAAVSKALELSLARFDGEINSVLDVGAGTGAGAIAAARLINCENNLKKITCVEREENMLALGRELCGAAGVSAVWEKGDVSRGIAKRADLVICSYCLNELPEAQREGAVMSLADAAEKLLVIVEPGTPFAFASLKKTRQTLIEGGFGIAAPCPFDHDCPLPEDDWCHFTARAQRSKLHKMLKNADVPYEDEKLCFVAAARGDFTPCAARVLRKPQIQSGMITLKLCAADGIKTETITKKSPLFKQARKVEHGGEFPLGTLAKLEKG